MTSILLYDKDTFILIIMFYIFLYIFCICCTFVDICCYRLDICDINGFSPDVIFDVKRCKDFIYGKLRLGPSLRKSQFSTIQTFVYKFPVN